jgi:cysteine desulfurase/selenocysteine lyase
MSIQSASSVTQRDGVRGSARPAYDVDQIREGFPILGQTVHGKPLVYLDNAATAQKPRQVLDALNRFYATANSNVHRGVHYLSERATRDYEDARITVQRFLGARLPREVIFVRGTTEAINLVAQSYGRQHVGQGDEIVISTMEHHSNIVPWQMLCEEKGARLRVIPINDAGEFSLEDYEKLLSDRTRLVAVVHVSNSLGTVNPVRQVIELAHRRGIPVLLDGAQSAQHLPIDVQELDCDFFAFSGHKIYGPTGIGVLYGKAELLEKMPPYQGGGDMISSVTFAKTTYNVLPYKFEAGTPDIAGAIGLAAALDYVTALGLERIAAHEHNLVTYATEALAGVPTLRLIGTARDKASVVSFTLEGIHPHDIGTILDQEGIAIRTGHHCCQPVMDRYQVPATARASMGLYNTRDEIDALVRGLEQVREVFA